MSDQRDVIYSVRGPKNIFEMTGHEFEELLPRTDVCLVAAGSVEAHGAHAPLGLDDIMVMDLARRTAVRLAQHDFPVFIAPLIPFGTAPGLASLPGTISISSEVLRSLLKEVCFSLVRHGIRRFVFLLGHVGNQPTMQLAAEDIIHESDAEVIYLNWVLHVGQEAARLGLLHEEAGGMVHGGESETARAMAAQPELVDLQHARKWIVPRRGGEAIQNTQPVFIGGALDRWTKSYDEIMPYRSAGDPTLATADTGEKLYEVGVDWCARTILREFGPSAKLKA